MSLKECVMKMPVWKAIVIIFLAISISAFILEEMVISHIVGFISRIVTTLETQAKEDGSDWKKTKELSNKIEIKNACQHIQWAREEIENSKLKNENPFMFNEHTIEIHAEKLKQFHLNESDCAGYVT